MSDQDINRPGHTNANEPPQEEGAALPLEEGETPEPEGSPMCLLAAEPSQIKYVARHAHAYGEIRVFTDGVELTDGEIFYTKKKKPRSP